MWLRYGHTIAPLANCCIPARLHVSARATAFTGFKNLDMAPNWAPYQRTRRSLNQCNVYGRCAPPPFYLNQLRSIRTMTHTRSNAHGIWLHGQNHTQTDTQNAENYTIGQRQSFHLLRPGSSSCCSFNVATAADAAAPSTELWVSRFTRSHTRRRWHEEGEEAAMRWFNANSPLSGRRGGHTNTQASNEIHRHGTIE